MALGSRRPTSWSTKLAGRFRARNWNDMGPDVLHGGNAAVPVLLDLLQAKDVAARQEAAGALARLGPVAADALPALRRMLNDQHSDMSSTAADVLGHIGTDALGALQEAAKDPRPEVRLSVAHSLGLLGLRAKGAVPVLVELLADPREEVRNQAGNALGQVDQQAAAKAGVREPEENLASGPMPETSTGEK
jgi:HEAT repeat protein